MGFRKSTNTGSLYIAHISTPHGAQGAIISTPVHEAQFDSVTPSLLPAAGEYTAPASCISCAQRLIKNITFSALNGNNSLLSGDKQL